MRHKDTLKANLKSFNIDVSKLGNSSTRAIHMA